MSSSGNGMKTHEANEPLSQVHIVVIGGAGVGKSSFIRLLLQNLNTGEYPEIVGHKLKCCTKDVVQYHFELDGRQGSIFDTPGFDDDGLDEGEVLTKIADYSKSTYEANFKVTAIFYLHEITRPRFSGSQIQMLDIFEKLCGPKSLQNVVIVTTKWDLLPKDDQIGERREAELLTDHMAMLVKLGAKHARHDNSIKSVLDIVQPAMRYATIKTRIQEELVDECKSLKDTEAGKRVAQDLRDKIDKMQKNWDKEQEAFQKKMEESGKEWAETLKRQREKDAEAYSEKVDKLQRDLDEVKSNKQSWVDYSLQALFKIVDNRGVSVSWNPKTGLPTVINAVSEGAKLYNVFLQRGNHSSGESGASEMSPRMQEVSNFVKESLEAAVLQEEHKISEWL